MSYKVKTVCAYMLRAPCWTNMYLKIVKLYMFGKPVISRTFLLHIVFIDLVHVWRY
jgi:hypothetical protein